MRRKFELVANKIQEIVKAVDEKKRNKAVYYLMQAEKLGEDLMKNVDYTQELIRRQECWTDFTSIEEELMDARYDILFIQMPYACRRVDMLERTRLCYRH